jgi:hypothetical protein
MMGRSVEHALRSVGGLDGYRYLPLPGKEGDGFRWNGSVGESNILRGDLSNQFFVP